MAQSASQFFNNVLASVEAISDLPRSRWDVDALIGASQEVGAILKARLAGIVTMPHLDPEHFGLPPDAFETVDPSVPRY